MSRHDTEKLRACPTCGTKGHDLGLRDYSRWLFDLLPARIGATDFDCVLEHHASGRMLILEFKPSDYIPRGQMLTFQNELSHGRDVWLVIDKHLPRLRIAPLVYGEPPKWEDITLQRFRTRVKKWWSSASNEAKASGSKGRPEPQVRKPPALLATRRMTAKQELGPGT